MSDKLTTLLDAAARIVDTDLYSARLRNVISELLDELKSTSELLEESRAYAQGLVQELRDREERHSGFVEMAKGMDADYEAYVSASKHKIKVRFTWASEDQEFWIHFKLPDGKSAGLNLGNPRGMIATAALRALVDGE